MSLYAAQKATAYGLLKRKGGPVPVSRVTASGYDPITQTESASTTTHSFLGIGLPVAKKEGEYDRDSLGFSYVLDFTLASRETPPFEPRPGDTLVWKGNVWTIKTASALDPSGDGAVLYSATAVR